MIFANDEISLDDAVVNNVEHGLASRCITNGIYIHVAIFFELSRKLLRIAGGKLDNEINVSCHSWLCIEAQRNGTRKHVRNLGRLELFYLSFHIAFPVPQCGVPSGPAPETQV